MTEEHRMQELSLLSTDKYRVTQWTFLHPTDKLLFYQWMNTAIDGRPGDVTTSEGETESLNNTRSNNNEHEDDVSTDVSEFSDDKYDGDVNELQCRYDHRVIRDFSNNSGDEDDASTKVSETNDDKLEEEVDEASVKPWKVKKNNSIWVEENATSAWTTSYWKTRNA